MQNVAEVNNVMLLSVYETEAYFYYKNIYPGKLFLLIKIPEKEKTREKRAQKKIEKKTRSFHIS